VLTRAARRCFEAARLAAWTVLATKKREGSRKEAAVGIWGCAFNFCVLSWSFAAISARNWRGEFWSATLFVLRQSFLRGDVPATMIAERNILRKLSTLCDPQLELDGTSFQRTSFQQVDGTSCQHYSQRPRPEILCMTQHRFLLKCREPTSLSCVVE